MSFDGYSRVLKGDLLEVTGTTCGWTRGPARHEEIWWWNGPGINSITES